MAFVRTRLAALAIIATVLTAAAAPALAAQAHPFCAANHHGCGQTATLARCCCGDTGSRSDQSGPVRTRALVVVDLATMPALSVFPHSSGPAERIVRVRAFPPGATPPDLVTLFATLLI